MGSKPGHFQCPFCNSFDVVRMYLASLGFDSCECSSCGARWDEDRRSGEYKGRSRQSAAVAAPARRLN